MRHRSRAPLAVPVLAAWLLVGCSPEAGVATLAKIDGWRDLDDERDVGGGRLELAYDRPTAERLWAENVPDGLPRADGDPREPGLYGDLDDVDFDAEVVALWSSVQSGSCPGWLASVRVEDGVVDVDEAVDAPPSGECTSDANPYRVVVVLPRAVVPAVDELPITGGDGAVAYP